MLNIRRFPFKMMAMLVWLVEVALTFRSHFSIYVFLSLFYSPVLLFFHSILVFFSSCHRCAYNDDGDDDGDIFVIVGVDVAEISVYKKPEF